MIVCVAGLPSAYARWCEGLIIRIFAVAGIKASRIFADTLSDLGRELLGRNIAHTLLIAQQPDQQLVKALSANRRFLHLVDDPRHCFLPALALRNETFLNSLRWLYNCSTASLQLKDVPGALRLNAMSPDHRGAKIAGVIAAHLRLPVRRQIAERIAMEPELVALEDAITADAASLDRQEAFYIPDSAISPERQQTLVDTTLGPFADILGAGRLMEIVWLHELFASMERPTQPLGGAVDVTGPPRCLIFGPNLLLPEGSWSCKVLFTAEPQGSSLSLAADIMVGGRSVLNRVAFRVEESGVFEIEFPFQHNQIDQGVEVRLFSETSAFEGRIALKQATLSRLSTCRLQAR